MFLARQKGLCVYHGKWGMFIARQKGVSVYHGKCGMFHARQKGLCVYHGKWGMCLPWYMQYVRYTLHVQLVDMADILIHAIGGWDMLVHLVHRWNLSVHYVGVCDALLYLVSGFGICWCTM